MQRRAGEAQMKLVAENLAAARGGRRLFAGISFAVGGGEALLVLGPNGSGKTTLIRIIAGLMAPAAGAIRLDGGDPALSVGEQCHYVGHLNALKGSLTVAENVGFWCRFLGRTRAEPEAALAAVGLAALSDIPAAYLSAGQKRRLGLARVLVAHRPIWLLDEPTVSLDETAQAALTRVIAAHLSAGGLLIAASHAALALPKVGELKLGDVAGHA
jgi:heme exporter protein A